MKLKTLIVGIAILASSISGAAAATYKVSFYKNGQWRGDMSVSDQMVGQCTVIYHFCRNQRSFYGCSSSSLLYNNARAGNWDYKLTSNRQVYCTNR